MKAPESLKIAILKASQKPWSDMINDRYMRYSIILNGYFCFKLNTLDFSVWQLRNCMEAAAGGCAGRTARPEQAASVAAAARELVPWLAAAALVALGSTLQTFALTRYALAPWRERFSIMLCPRKS